MRRSLLTLAFALTGAAYSAEPQGATRWLDRHLFDRIHITGYRFLGFHSHQVTGDVDTFNSLTYYGQGNERFTDTGQLTVSGRDVLGLFNFDANINDSRFKDPQNQRFSLNFNRNGFTVDAGDIQGSLLNTNPYASVNKQVKGLGFGYKKGPFAIKFLRTDTKGASRTISLQGINSPGPYYLSSSQIIRGTERVEVDGQTMVLGTDYTISYEIGAIQFVGRSIAPTSTILVTYEALDFNGTPGTVQGVGSSVDFGKFGKVGLTAIEQKSHGSNGISSRVEQFEGFGAAGTPYFLQFEPLSTIQYPTLIRVNGVLQTENADYYFDPTNRSIFYFRRFIPGTSIVEVVYFPRPTSAANGDRQVTGIDYRLPFGPKGSYLQYSQATAKLTNTATPLSGTAKGIQAVYKSGGLELKGGLRDIPDTFIGIETTGFNRNERAMDLSAEYKRKNFTYGASHQNSAVSTRSVDQDGATILNKGRQTATRLYTTYTTDRWSWNAEQSRRTVSTVRGDTRLDTTSFFGSRGLGKLDLRFGVDHQSGIAPDTAGVPSRLAMDSLRLDADYRPSSAWTLGWRSSLSKTKYAGASGNGHDLGLSAAFRPSTNFSLDMSYTDSDSGQLATLSGFEGSLGYDGNGFSSGALGTAFSAGTTNQRLWNLHSRYQPTERLALDARLTKSRSSGSLYTNTDSTFFGLGLDYDMGGGHSISVGLEQNDTAFLDSPNRSTSRSLSLNFAGRPKGPWSYRMGASAILSGGGLYSQDSLSFDASLFYRIDDRQQAYLSVNSGRTTGYLPQSDQFFGAFYEYRLFQNVSLIGSYKIRKLMNLDPLATSGAYRSRGFDLELSFSFGG